MYFINRKANALHNNIHRMTSKSCVIELKNVGVAHRMYCVQANK